MEIKKNCAKSQIEMCVVISPYPSCCWWDLILLTSSSEGASIYALVQYHDYFSGKLKVLPSYNHTIVIWKISKQNEEKKVVYIHSWRSGEARNLWAPRKSVALRPSIEKMLSSALSLQCLPPSQSCTPLPGRGRQVRKSRHWVGAVKNVHSNRSKARFRLNEPYPLLLSHYDISSIDISTWKIEILRFSELLVENSWRWGVPTPAKTPPRS